MQVSFIIPLYNCLALTQECLRTLPATLPAGLRHEIVFVDDGSTDGTREWLATLGAPCRVILNERNLGFAATCNRGAAAAQGEFLFFLNNDLEFLPGWLEPMVVAFARSEKIGAVGNRQIRVDTGALDHAGMQISAQGKIKHVQVLPRGRITARSLVTVPGVTAACVAVRRVVFLSAGRFDEEFFNGGEDVDFCFRLQAKHGLRIVVALASVVRHHVSAARGPTNARDERNSRRLVQRWREQLVYWGALTWAQEQESSLARWWTAAGREAWTVLPFALGWAQSVPRVARLVLESALHREEVRWQRFFDLSPGTPRAPRDMKRYQVSGFYRDVTEMNTGWLRDRAWFELPPGFPVSNVFINGFLLPVPADRSEADRSIGVRIRINGRQVAELTQVALGNFNLGIDAPFVLPGETTRVEVELIGVAWTNFLAWAGRITEPIPFPVLRWHRWLKRFRYQALNRRLRFSQLVCDDEVVFDFKRDPSLAPALRRRRPDATGLNVIGWLRAAVGIGESARCMVRACDAAQLPVALIDMKLNCLNRLGDDSFAARLQDDAPHTVNVFHIDPPVSDQIDHHHGPALRENGYNVAYWAWELPEFPDAWVRQSTCFDEIWCPSEFVRTAIAAKVDLPIVVMPHAIGFTEPAGDARAHFSLPGDRFLFLVVYDLNSSQERKNPLGAIEAYRRAFPEETGVGLVIKTQNGERHRDAFARLQSAIAGLRQVTLIAETLSVENIRRLESACDTFVSLHRAEGFGLGLAECMYLGKPVIATDWSAPSEFINETNGCPVRCSLVQLQETHGPYTRGQTWAEPDLDHAASWMRRLVGESGLANRLGAAARMTVQERFSPAVIGAKYQQRLAMIAQSPA